MKLINIEMSAFLGSCRKLLIPNLFVVINTIFFVKKIKKKNEGGKNI
jgi:hypothetical protein